MSGSNAPQAITEPLAQLRWIASLLRAITYLDGTSAVARQAISSAQWLDDAVSSHLYGGVAMDRAMGLAGGQGRQSRFYALLRERNRHLGLALMAMGGDVGELLAEIDRYESRVSLAQRERQQPDPLWGDARKHIHAAARLGIDLPRTSKGLRKTLSITSAGN